MGQRPRIPCWRRLFRWFTLRGMPDAGHPVAQVVLGTHETAVKDVADSPHGLTLASADERGVVRLRDAHPIMARASSPTPAVEHADRPAGPDPHPARHGVRRGPQPGRRHIGRRRRRHHPFPGIQPGQPAPGQRRLRPHHPAVRRAYGAPRRHAHRATPAVGVRRQPGPPRRPLRPAVADIFPGEPMAKSVTAPRVTDRHFRATT